MCREELSLKREIDSRIEAICREGLKKYQTNTIGSECIVEFHKCRDREYPQEWCETGNRLRSGKCCQESDREYYANKKHRGRL